MQRASSLGLIFIFSIISSVISYQPYSSFNPAPTPEIGLGASINGFSFIDFTSTVYTQLAHETFLDNLRERHPLSALYFNKSDFRMSQIFQDCLVPTNTEFYNPYIRVLPLKPRITFSEIGTHLNLRAEAGFGEKKWLHIGVKASISVKRRMIERQDTGTRGPANVQNVVRTAETWYPNNDLAIGNAQAFRLDFVEALPAYYAQDGSVASNFQESITFDINNEMSIFGQIANEDNDELGAAFVVKKEGYYPGSSDIIIQNIPYGTDGAQVTGYLPQRITSVKEDNIYEVGIASDSTDYRSMLDSSTKSVSQRIADQDAKAKTWVVGIYDNNFGVNQTFYDMTTSIVEKVAQYPDNEYQWLYNRDHSLESQLCQGIGDARIEGYLAADLFDSFQIRLSGGAVLPTARQQTTGKSPYAIHLGNRGHVECFIGGGITLAIPHSRWFITSDAYYTTALSATEYISATPRGAQIKNMGPEIPADISWHSTHGNVWLHMQHPKALNLSCSIGYEWNSKIEDTLIFPATPVYSLLGNTFNATSRKYDIKNPLTLDPEIAKNHTGAISHTMRLATTYAPSSYFKIYAQTGYVLAGRNVPQVIECAIGCTISF